MSCKSEGIQCVATLISVRFLARSWNLRGEGFPRGYLKVVEQPLYPFDRWGRNWREWVDCLITNQRGTLNKGCRLNSPLWDSGWGDWWGWESCQAKLDQSRPRLVPFREEPGCPSSRGIPDLYWVSVLYSVLPIPGLGSLQRRWFSSACFPWITDSWVFTLQTLKIVMLKCG